MSQCTADTHDSSALTRRSPRGPTQNTMAGGTALWGLEGKPLMPMVNATGSLILLFRLKSRVDFHGSTRVEALSLLGTMGLSLQRPCPQPPASHTRLASSFFFFSIFIIWLSWVIPQWHEGSSLTRVRASLRRAGSFFSCSSWEL